MKLSMNLAELQKKLIMAARKSAPDDSVPYAFEKRIMARLGKPSQADDWALLARALWCGAVVCMAVVIDDSLFRARSTYPLECRKACVCLSDGLWAARLEHLDRSTALC